jgi:hypothetical protein
MMSVFPFKSREEQKEDLMKRIKDWQQERGVVGAMPIDLLMADMWMYLKQDNPQEESK